MLLAAMLHIVTIRHVALAHCCSLQLNRAFAALHAVVR